MNISNQTLEILKVEFLSFFFHDGNCNEVAADKASELHIGIDKDGYYIGKGIKATKKETTIDYIYSKINQHSIYKNFSDYFNSLIKKHGLSAYPTTYGIGVFCLFNFKNSTTEALKKIEDLLKELKVQYTTEYSGAGWVFRFKISKSENNINHIQSLIKQ